MNGRIYDPELGRMLSPDPVVQVAEYSQNFNRYSYVMNNPLNLTDPSGFSFFSDVLGGFGVHTAVNNWVQENWRMVVCVVIAIIAWYAAPYILGAFGASTAAGGLAATGANATAASLAAQGAVAGAIVGGSNAAINGGDLSDVLRGAAIGAVQGAIAGGVLHGMAPKGTEFSFQMAEHVAGHGVLGGACNVAMGGKFQDGFLSAAVSAGAMDLGLVSGGVVSKAIKSGIIGGTASALGGGKFANGALTAAFQYLTNEAAAEYRDRLLNSKPCIQCHGVSARGFSGDVNDWELGTLMTPEAESSLHVFSGVSKESMCDLGFEVGETAAIVAVTRGIGVGMRATLGALGEVSVPIYRVYGGAARITGRSYTFFNPRSTPFYRYFAGLPRSNTGQYLLKSSVQLKDVTVGRMFAAPLDGNLGGLPLELYQKYNSSNSISILLKTPL